MKHTNSLINSKSPYLLQHAHNPVNWHAWSEELFERAKKEDKLVLISIGYSSCHWCHVMEHECFEEEEVAALMNERFINIKVDREERPDVDHIYMTAVQLMSGHGGWPLNCFVLPDGRPIYGGTYFPRQRWMELLKNLSEMYRQNKSKVLEYAGELTQGIRQVSEFAVPPEETLFTSEDLAGAVDKWKKRFDKQEGGMMGAPKFPMPNNYLFLLRYGVLQADADLLLHVHLTLGKMARGGIYDQLGGGFARYSTDEEWKVPHFEKMLYDNAQLISLYCEAYRQQENELYKKVVYESIEFIKREMASASGGFYSALDADSEGKEGLFYIWTQEELKEVLPDHYSVFADYYSVNANGYWEDDFYILLRGASEENVLANHTLNPEDLQRIIAECKQKLMERRDTRVRPGLDDKIIASWNGLMGRALCDAYATFGDAGFAALARQNAAFITKTLLQPDGSLLRCAKNDAGYGPAFLDDYAFCLDAFLALFTTFGEAEYLQKAESLAAYCFDHFYSKDQRLFEYTPRGGEALISKNFEVSDNVIPSSNSQMALNLQALHAITGKSRYEETAQNMLKRMAPFIRSSPSSSSNWWLAVLRREFAFYEVCVVGKDVDEFMRAFAKHYHPNAIFVYSKQASEAALLKDRFKAGQTLVYVCSQQACQTPVATAQEALEQLK